MSAKHEDSWLISDQPAVFYLAGIALADLMLTDPSLTASEVLDPAFRNVVAIMLVQRMAGV
ncbi:MAG TPA: hypothetical protein VL334_02520 [Anaerolineae bacterium]|nr:hypothetical protein [Anaerolineae bacterium]